MPRHYLATLLLYTYWFTVYVCVSKSTQFETPADWTSGLTIFFLMFFREDFFTFLDWFVED